MLVPAGNCRPEAIGVQKRFSGERMAQLVHPEIHQARSAVFSGKAQRGGQPVAAFLDGDLRDVAVNPAQQQHQHRAAQEEKQHCDRRP